MHIIIVNFELYNKNKLSNYKRKMQKIFIFIVLLIILNLVNGEDINIDLKHGQRIERGPDGEIYIVEDVPDEDVNININHVSAPPGRIYDPLDNDIPNGRPLVNWNINLNDLQNQIKNSKNSLH